MSNAKKSWLQTFSSDKDLFLQIINNLLTEIHFQDRHGKPDILFLGWVEKEFKKITYS